MPSKGVINLRGKRYKTVALRVAEFREHCSGAEGWAILTEPTDVTERHVIVRASIVDPSGRTVAVGWAEETREKGRGVNATSALENCETSAIGRALANFGLGGEEYSSADELLRAMHQQGRDTSAATAEPAEPEPPQRWTDKQRAAFCATLADLPEPAHYDDVAEWCESLGKPRPSVMTGRQRSNLIKYLRDGDGATKLRAHIAASAAKEQA